VSAALGNITPLQVSKICKRMPLFVININIEEVNLVHMLYHECIKSMESVVD
jgi:hypothetical protein